MDARRLLIAEYNEDLRLALARQLQAFHYVRCCGNGAEALEILRREKPDLLVLGMNLPELDGLTLLETIAAENIRPMVLALLTYRSAYLEASAQRLGIEYMLLKPCPLENIVNRVLDMKQYLKYLPSRRTPDQYLQELLLPLGITPLHQGYPILSDAILRMAADPGNPLCKAVYLDTAKHCGTTFQAVESQIRRIIENSWDADSWQIYFPEAQRYPSAKVFLKRIVQLLREAME